MVWGFEDMFEEGCFAASLVPSLLEGISSFLYAVSKDIARHIPESQIEG